MKRTFVCYFFYVGWWSWSLGFSLDPSSPNIEVHVPFGFFRVGFIKPPTHFLTSDENLAYVKNKSFGID